MLGSRRIIRRQNRCSCWDLMPILSADRPRWDLGHYADEKRSGPGAAPATIPDMVAYQKWQSFSEEALHPGAKQFRSPFQGVIFRRRRSLNPPAIGSGLLINLWASSVVFWIKKAMDGSLAGVWRRRGGIGIVPSLLMASLLAVVSAVVIVQFSTLRSIILSEEHAAQERLDVNLGMLKHELLGRGSDWRLGTDGRLMVDGKVAEGLDQVVEDVARITNSVATVFAGDTRMATTVKRPDGSPAVGTKLAAGPARAAVIDSKMSYRGTADILGVQYFTVYEPLLDRDGRAAGILFVGVPSAKVQAVLNSIIWQTSEVALVVLLIGAVSIWLMLRATLRPLLALAGVVHTISDGQLDVSVPCADRSDQLGQIGRAVEILRDKAQHAHALGMQAARDREAQDRRQAAIDLVTQDFGGSLSGVLVGLVASASGMRDLAGDVAGAAEQTRSDMESTTSEAEMSSQNLSRVAAAADQLTASVSEISRQVDQAATAAHEAVEQARTADRRCVTSAQPPVKLVRLSA